ncbi:indolepyruvate ferredoxin oxidoreductase beta subunit [Desulfacinum infernum DSM 9756]|uniref:Indolepyruvate ferredoxin oxidoreductase beta subunit n=1 Tax=Desulfacinum infernum DSM 9756 TaxID=1121391 RepID=A0A1M5FME5_9BACT|nr:indolepyruvate oxidoreductase subunit beta [Desulfacinum infernum]SHF92675.1 indolepyruvate ferredoxin oxidoreductase beta subunit [Desulfacinum infernum DSM 9756]
MTTQKRMDAGLRIFFTGVGGQGTLLATRMVGEAALIQGLNVTMSEIHGMAQRGGVVESSIVVGDIASPIIADGQADVMLAFEPLEAIRALGKCHAGTTAVVNTVPIVPFTVAAGQGQYPDVQDVLEDLQESLAKVVALDAVTLAREAGNVRAANMVVVGAFAGLQVLPVERSAWEESVRRLLPPKLHDVNERAFALGFDAGRAVA